MLIKSKELANQLRNSGIYFIRCNSNNKMYIGQSKYMRGRLSRHFQELRKGVHSNPKLQNVYNKYGEDSFSIGVVEVCSNLDDREQYYLDVFGYHLLNILKVGEIPKWKDNPEWYERCQKGMDRRKEYNALSSEEKLARKYVKRPSLGKRTLMNKHVMTDEERESRRLKSQETWTEEKRAEVGKPFRFVSPDGVLFEGKSIGLFCIEHGLRANKMRDVRRGHIRSYRGWSLPTDDPNYKPKGVKREKVITNESISSTHRKRSLAIMDGKDWYPDIIVKGVRYSHIKDLKAFCDEHGIYPNTLRMAIKNRQLKVYNFVEIDYSNLE